MRLNVLALAIVLPALLLPLATEAKHDDVSFDFQKNGGAKSLGVQALERVLRKSGQHHKTVDELARDLDKDPDMGVDLANSMLIYACAGMAVEAPVTSQSLDHHHSHHSHDSVVTAQAIGSWSGGELASGYMPHTPDPGSITQAQAFSLHSRPSATRKIFLDFDGHTTTGTAWNSWKGIDPIVTPAYDEDGDPTTFSAMELSDILAIWRAVSEDYAPFDVDVTTEDPGAAYLATNGVRAVIGGSSYDWLGSGAGGIAYVGVFGQYNNYYQPAFVFPAQLGGGYPKYVWEAISHEVGHNVGLNHDGTATDAYYTGQGSWAPIMGAGYYVPVTHFSKGEYANANNFEDDFTVMSGYLGAVTAIAEEHGSDMATATPLAAVMNADGVTGTATASGIIKYPLDADVFSFSAATAGTATLQVFGMPAWGSTGRANLNVQLNVTNAVGTSLASISGLGIPSFPVSLPAAGTYYIFLSGAGSGDPVTNGYSSYGSRGQYEVTVSYPAVLVPSPSPSPSPTPSPSPSPTPSPSPSPTPSPSPSPTPSPSPSPTPSPSPSPTPSPSPSPKPSPSPSPRPSPSPTPTPPPSPSPAPNVMTISSISGSKASSGTKASPSYTCTFKVTIVNKATGAKLGGAAVSGTWNSDATVSGWPYPTATAVTTATSGQSMGIASITSTKTLPAGPGNGCYFTVTSVTLPNWTLDPAAVTTSSKLTW